jgi:hypothetical protein
MTLASALVAHLALALPTTTPPHFDSPPTPPCGTVFSIYAGQTISFTVQASHPDPRQLVTLRSAYPFPAGLTMTPALSTSALGTVSSVLHWTPTVDQIGDYGFNFLALAQERVSCTFRIEVHPPAQPLCTFTQGGWGSKPSGNNPGQLLKSNFASVYPGGVEVGIPGAAGFSLRFTSASGIENFLPSGSTPGALNADATNPTSPTSAGVLAGQVLALQLNVDFSAAGVTPVSLGNLKLCNTGNPALDGETVSDVLAAANHALGGGALPYGLSYSGLNDLVTNLNESHDDCEATGWATAHLCN